MKILHIVNSLQNDTLFSYSTQSVELAIVLLFTGLLQIITAYIHTCIYTIGKEKLLNKKKLVFISSKMKTYLKCISSLHRYNVEHSLMHK